jgi:hypothetical protein
LGAGAGLPDSFKTDGQGPLSEATERLTVPVGLLQRQTALREWLEMPLRELSH